MALSFEERAERLKKQLIKALGETARALLAPATAGTLKFRDPVGTVGGSYLALRCYRNPKAHPEALRTGYDTANEWVCLEEQPLDYLLRIYARLTPRYPALVITRDDHPTA